MMENERVNNRIVFFLDAKNAVATTQKIFIDLALHMSHIGYDVMYVNNTHERDLECNPELAQIFFDVNKVNYSELDGATFFTPINYLMHLLVRIRTLKNAKICLYMYNESAIKWLCVNTGNKLSENKICSLVSDTVSCSFLNKFSIPKVLRDSLENYIIMPYSVFKSKDWFDNQTIDEVFCKDNCINIGYFGDIYAGLAPSLNNILSNLAKCEIAERIRIHLIGNTSAIPNVNLTGVSESGVSLVLTGKLSEAEQIEYAKNNIDIAFAMNYDAVNIAAAAIPVFIPVVNTKPFAGNRYVQINDVTNFDFSWDNLSLLYKNYNCYTMEYLLNEIIYKRQKHSFGETASQFVFNNCSIELAGEKLIDLMSNTKLDLDYLLDLGEIKGLLRQYAEYGKEDGYDNFLIWLKNKNSKPSVAKPIPVAKPTTVQRAKTMLKKALPHIYYLYKNKKFLDVQNSYGSKIKAIRKSYLNGNKIKVGFSVVFDSVFPSRPIFEKMCNMDEFDPYIIVTPNVSGTLKRQRELFEKTYSSLVQDYGKDRIIKAYDIPSDTYLELKSEYSILFFSNPYKELVHPYHEIEYFLNRPVLPIYVSYGFAALSYWEEVVAKDFYNYLWKACVETPSNLKHLKKVQAIKGKNGVVTGYIKADGLANVVPTPRDRKRILICPHHTVWGWKPLNISNFLTYSELFVELPKMYPDVDFVFRPHPLLVDNLRNHKIWTQEQIDDYFVRMLESPNITYDTSGDYYQQFVDSDAMIHDCGSFIGEYLYTEKPCCYMIKSEEETYKGLVPLGQQCMDQYYHAKSKEDIIDFIENVVIKGNDPMKAQREAFVKNELKANYPHAADTMINMIKKELKIK